MKYSLILVLFLTGCSIATPVARKFPDVPDTITQKCQELEPLGENAKLSDIAKSVTSNYTHYYECSNRHDAFVEWYKTQKKIFEDVK
jgi:hypothetical protein